MNSLKIIIVGDPNVGKSNIINQFTDLIYNESYISTIGIDFKIREIEIDDIVLKLQLWDTAGQERFRTISNCYYRGANGILLVYDVTNNQSFENICYWQKEVEKFAKYNVIQLLVANKCDLIEKRVVTEQQGRELANKLLIPYMETSAKLNQNITEVMIEMTKMIVKIENRVFKSPINLIYSENLNEKCC